MAGGVRFAVVVLCLLSFGFLSVREYSLVSNDVMIRDAVKARWEIVNAEAHKHDKQLNARPTSWYITRM